MRIYLLFICVLAFVCDAAQCMGPGIDGRVSDELETIAEVADLL